MNDIDTSVFYGDPVPIQSPGGQQRIREKHIRRMAALDKYPTIRKHVHDDKWADWFLKQMLAKDGDVLSLEYPILYVAPEREGYVVGLSAGYTAKVDKGIEFLVAKAPPANLKDLIGNLRKSYSGAAVFEVLLSNALVTQTDRFYAAMRRSSRRSTLRS